MNRIDELNEQIEAIKNTYLQKKNLLSSKEEEDFICNRRIEAMKKNEEDIHYTIPSQIKREILPSIIEGIIALVIGLFAFYILANIVSVPSIAFLIKAALIGLIPANVFSISRFLSKTKRNRAKLKNFNNANFYKELTELQAKKGKIKNEIILLKSNLFELNEQRKTIEREIQNITSDSLNVMIPRLEYFTDVDKTSISSRQR